MDSLPLPLLKQLIRERGMRADHEEWVLRANLKKWLELSLDNEVPITLLIASRVFSLQHGPGVEEAELLSDHIKSMSDESISEMYVESAGVVDAATEIKVVDKQAKLIAEERQLLQEQQELKQDNIDPDLLKQERDELMGEYQKQYHKIDTLVKSLQDMISESDKDHKFDSEKKKLQKLQTKLSKILEEGMNTSQIKDFRENLRVKTSQLIYVYHIG